MSQLIEVAFKGNRKDFFIWDQDEAPPLRAAVIVDADRGEDLGRVHSTGDSARTRCEKCAHGLGGELPTRRALRIATAQDVRRERELRLQDEEARRSAMEHVKAHGLIMKLSDAEWQWDKRKLTLYFTAEKRVDFRQLVRDLASTFRARIELKQIGVRDEARRLDGIGRCGRQYCSASWLPELRPVNLGVAKDQRLSLNPSQISGACGRLMCCLRYEHEFYVQSRKRFPKEGKTVLTQRGEEKILSNDIFRDRVTLRNNEGDVRTIALLDLRSELEDIQRKYGEGANRVDSYATDEYAVEEWRRLSGRMLPLARDDAGDVERLLENEGEAVEPGIMEEFEPAAAEPERAESAEHGDRPRRRRGRRGGRRTNRRGRRNGDGQAGGGERPNGAGNGGTTRPADA